MSRFAKLATDANAESAGVWREWTNGANSIEFLIARAGNSNKAFRIASEKATRPFRKASMELEQLPPDKQDEVSRQIYSETVVLNWRGDGVDGVPFDPEACRELFTTVPDTLVFVVREAQNVSNYRKAALDTEAGN